MKLGFCFLCQNDIYHLDVWLNFFENNYNKSNIYIHSYEKEKITQDFVKKYQIDKNILTKWGDIYDVVKYVMKLSQINNDIKLILISESTIPCKPFHYVYDYLTRDNYGYMDYILRENEPDNLSQMQRNRYKINCDQIEGFQENIDYSHWFYNETWIIYNQEMIDLIMNDTKYYSYFKKGFALNENYPVYVLSYLNKLDLCRNISTTFTYWSPTINNNKIYHISYNYVSCQFKHPNKLFARKIKKYCNITNDILELYDLYKNKPAFIYDKCVDVLNNISKNYVFKEDILFTYLRSKYEPIHIYKKIYRLIDKDITDELNNKLRMGLLLNDNEITPKIYTSSKDLVKDNYEKDKIWYVKYITGSCGKDITCKTTDQLRSFEIDPKFIIQEGIMDVDLYQGYKYTLRTFLLFHDQKIYLYRGLKKRVHNEKYDTKSLNYSANVCGSNYLERIPIYLDNKDNLYQKLKDHTSLMKDKLRNIIDKTDKYTYLLIGNDYLVKEDKNIILIEMNTSPNINNSKEVNEKINIPLMKDTINLVVNNEINNYELI